MNKKQKELKAKAMDLTAKKLENTRLNSLSDLVRGLDDVIENTKFVLTGREMTSLFKARQELRLQVDICWDEAHREVIIDLLQSVDEYRVELKKLKKQLKKG